uniref:Uncharacterized protein n=1 Tax=Oryza glumipatula TaxID=40148 RepID=A0A0D9Y772_9ORYZ
MYPPSLALNFAILKKKKNRHPKPPAPIPPVGVSNDAFLAGFLHVTTNARRRSTYALAAADLRPGACLRAAKTISFANHELQIDAANTLTPTAPPRLQIDAASAPHADNSGVDFRLQVTVTRRQSPPPGTSTNIAAGAPRSGPPTTNPPPAWRSRPVARSSVAHGASTSHHPSSTTTPVPIPCYIETCQQQSPVAHGASTSHHSSSMTTLLPILRCTRP